MEQSFVDENFQITDGTRYLGGYVGVVLESCLEGKVQEWGDSSLLLNKVSQHVPQATFVGLQRSLQNEWLFIHIVSDLDKHNGLFQSLENYLEETLLEEIFRFTPPTCVLTKLPFKQSGLSIPNPTERSRHNYDTSKRYRPNS